MCLITYEMLVYIEYKLIMANSLSFRSILDTNKLIELNFINWFQNIKIVLKQENKAYVLDDLIHKEPNEEASNEEREAYQVHMKDLDLVTCVILFLRSLMRKLLMKRERLIEFTWKISIL